MALFSFAAITSVMFADEHDDHDHDHEEGETKSIDNARESNQWLEQMGLALEMVESRDIKGEDVIALPIRSVIHENGKNYVLARNEKDHSIGKWPVTLGHSDDQFVEAVTGVFPGDYIVVKKIDHHHDGHNHLVIPEPAISTPLVAPIPIDSGHHNHSCENVQRNVRSHQHHNHNHRSHRSHRHSHSRRHHHHGRHHHH